MKIACIDGVKFRHLRLCDVTHLKLKQRWWFAVCDDGKVDSNHFRTLKDAEEWVRAGGRPDPPGEVEVDTE